MLMGSIRNRQARCMARQAGREVSAVDGIGTMGEGVGREEVGRICSFLSSEWGGGTSRQGGLTQLRGNQATKFTH